MPRPALTRPLDPGRTRVEPRAIAGGPGRAYAQGRAARDRRRRRDRQERCLGRPPIAETLGCPAYQHRRPMAHISSLRALLHGPPPPRPETQTRETLTHIRPDHRLGADPLRMSVLQRDLRCRTTCRSFRSGWSIKISPRIPAPTSRSRPTSGKRCARWCLRGRHGKGGALHPLGYVVPCDLNWKTLYCSLTGKKQQGSSTKPSSLSCVPDLASLLRCCRHAATPCDVSMVSLSECVPEWARSVVTERSHAPVSWDECAPHSEMSPVSMPADHKRPPLEQERRRAAQPRRPLLQEASCNATTLLRYKIRPSQTISLSGVVSLSEVVDPRRISFLLTNSSAPSAPRALVPSRTSLTPPNGSSAPSAPTMFT